MNPGEHLRITGSALKNWLIAQVQDSIAVGLLWLVGLYILHVPWTPLWALLAMFLQVIPHLGPILSLIGPVLAATFRWLDWEHPLYVLILYAVVVVVDGLILQPYIMRRTAKVPIWASILTPLVLAFFLPFWGVLLSAPLLAVAYAYKSRSSRQSSQLLPAARLPEELPQEMPEEIKDGGTKPDRPGTGGSRKPHAIIFIRLHSFRGNPLISSGGESCAITVH